MPRSRDQLKSTNGSQSRDERPAMARAMEWVSHIMTVSLEMVLPGLAGYWLDQRLGTWILFMLIGFALGGVAAIVHLIHLTRTSDDSNNKKLTNKPSTNEIEGERK